MIEKKPRHRLRYVMVLFVALQILLPITGLYVSNKDHQTFAFSWAMFSRVPEDSGGQ
jgi:hypothetical protein